MVNNKPEVARSLVKIELFNRSKIFFVVAQILWLIIMLTNLGVHEKGLFARNLLLWNIVLAFGTGFYAIAGCLWIRKKQDTFQINILLNKFFLCVLMLCAVTSFLAGTYLLVQLATNPSL